VRSRARAAVKADRAGIAMSRFKYRDAAAFYQEAAAIVANRKAERWRYAFDEIDALLRHGDEYDDGGALETALERTKGALALLSRDQDPLLWAEARLRLGRMLLLLGRRSGDAARLKEAGFAFESVGDGAKPDQPAFRAARLGRVAAIREFGVASGVKETVCYATSACEELLRALPPDAPPLNEAELRLALGECLLRLAQLTRNDDTFAEAWRNLTGAREAIGLLSRPRHDVASMLLAELLLLWGISPENVYAIHSKQLSEAESDLPPGRMLSEWRRLYGLQARLEEHRSLHPAPDEKGEATEADKVIAFISAITQAKTYYEKAVEATPRDTRLAEWAQFVLRLGEMRFQMFEVAAKYPPTIDTLPTTRGSALRKPRAL
jgi:tetratricopeptide (TPR) repeat protein